MMNNSNFYSLADQVSSHCLCATCAEVQPGCGWGWSLTLPQMVRLYFIAGERERSEAPILL